MPDFTFFGGRQVLTWWPRNFGDNLLPATVPSSVITPCPDNRARLQTLMESWLHSGASTQAVSMMTLTIQQHLLDILHHIVTPEQEINLDVEDIEYVFKGSQSILFSQATTLGADRALVAGQQLWQTATLAGNESMNWSRLLLSIQSGPAPELEMDEIIDIIEYVRDKAGEESEVVFGHAIDTTLGASLRVVFLASST